MGYRTIEQAYEIIHEFDNGSAITKYFLRMLCKCGQIQVINVGSKFLINMDSLFQFLNINIKEN